MSVGLLCPAVLMLAVRDVLLDRWYHMLLLPGKAGGVQLTMFG